jgi:hypothetical protein
MIKDKDIVSPSSLEEFKKIADNLSELKDYDIDNDEYLLWRIKELLRDINNSLSRPSLLSYNPELQKLDENLRNTYKRDILNMGYLLSFLITSDELKSILRSRKNKNRDKISKELFKFLLDNWLKIRRKYINETEYYKHLEKILNTKSIPTIGFEIEYHSNNDEKIHKIRRKSIIFPFESHEKEIQTKAGIQVRRQIKEVLQLILNTNIQTATLHLTVAGVSAAMNRDFMCLRLFCDAANFIPRRNLYNFPNKLKKMKRGDIFLTEAEVKREFINLEKNQYFIVNPYHRKRLPNSDSVTYYCASTEIGVMESRSFSRINLKEDWIGLVRTLDFYDIAKFAVAIKSVKLDNPNIKLTEVEKKIIKIWDAFFYEFIKLFNSKGIEIPENFILKISAYSVYDQKNSDFVKVHNQAVGYGMTDEDFRIQARRLITKFKSDVGSLVRKSDVHSKNDDVNEKSFFTTILSSIRRGFSGKKASLNL